MPVSKSQMKFKLVGDQLEKNKPKTSQRYSQGERTARIAFGQDEKTVYKIYLTSLSSWWSFKSMTCLTDEAKDLAQKKISRSNLYMRKKAKPQQEQGDCRLGHARDPSHTAPTSAIDGLAVAAACPQWREKIGRVGRNRKVLHYAVICSASNSQNRLVGVQIQEHVLQSQLPSCSPFIYPSSSNIVWTISKLE